MHKSVYYFYVAQLCSWPYGTNNFPDYIKLVKLVRSNYLNNWLKISEIYFYFRRNRPFFKYFPKCTCGAWSWDYET